DDPYSHLTAQILQPLLNTYDIKLTPMLVGPPSGDNAPELEMLMDYSRLDSINVAPHYGLDFPSKAAKPDSTQVDLASRILAAVDTNNFPKAAVDIGAALWSGNIVKLKALAEQYGCTDLAEAKAAVLIGTERRHQLKHYSGAMLYYGGEWYWGTDRLYHLENRLIELGARKSTKSKLIVPRPEIDSGNLKDDGSLTLEFFPSLRSPYSAIIFDRVIELVKDSGIRLTMRPVVPMVMRGVSLSRQKGVYIFTDTRREGETLGLNWGNAYDPIGRPVLRAFSLYPWARKQGKSTAFLSAFLKAAFFEAVNTNNDQGLRYVVEKAGLSWQDAQSVIDNTDWEEELERNRLAMYSFGCWGVPSFRLFDANNNVVLATWGQDRLWLVAREIKRLLEQRKT
ncbi:DsbA family protein, partial [bacterium]|nr:DsbA family protein [bacterium]